MWHIYTPQGQQYGPLNKQTLDAWVAEGRVRPDWYLCQAGWSEWKLARDLYPQLGGGGVAVAAMPTQRAAAPAARAPTQAQATTEAEDDHGESIAQVYSRKAGNPWVFWGGMLAVAGVLAIGVGIFVAQKTYELASGTAYRDKAYHRYEALGDKSQVRDWVDEHHMECYRTARGDFAKYFELMDAKVQAAADPSGETKFRTTKKGKR